MIRFASLMLCPALLAAACSRTPSAPSSSSRATEPENIVLAARGPITHGESRLIQGTITARVLESGSQLDLKGTRGFRFTGYCEGRPFMTTPLLPGETHEVWSLLHTPCGGPISFEGVTKHIGAMSSWSLLTLSIPPVTIPTQPDWSQEMSLPFTISGRFGFSGTNPFEELLVDLSGSGRAHFRFGPSQPEGAYRLLEVTLEMEERQRRP